MSVSWITSKNEHISSLFKVSLILLISILNYIAFNIENTFSHPFFSFHDAMVVIGALPLKILTFPRLHEPGERSSNGSPSHFFPLQSNTVKLTITSITGLFHIVVISLVVLHKCVLINGRFSRVETNEGILRESSTLVAYKIFAKRE